MIWCATANHIKALIVKDCQLTYILPSDPKQISRQKDAQAFEKFIGCLGYNRSITALNLSHNRCHSNEKEGATIGQMLARLMTLGNLTSVDISWMNLGSQAVEHIAEQLYEMSYGRQLEKLKLNFCKKLENISAREFKEVEEYGKFPSWAGERPKVSSKEEHTVSDERHGNC